MKIRNLLDKDEFAISFEVFPPKTQMNYESVETATRNIAALKPEFMSVTYGAGGGTSEYTVSIAKDLQQRYEIPMMAHLTCITSTQEKIANQLSLLRENGIENILALRGDIPEGMEEEAKNRSFEHASDLITEIKKHGDFCIGGACYPEVHPDSDSQKQDIENLKKKVDAGCEFLVTQMFFDNNILYNFLYKIREAGISVPVMPGIMPITNAKQMKRTIKLSGTQLPQRFIRILETFGDSPQAMRQAGIAYATEQIIDLYANGVKKVHVYSMNQPMVAEAIMNNLSDILG